MPATIAQLWIYPVKSLKGIRLETSRVTARGLGTSAGQEALVPRTNDDGTENWQYEPGTNSVRFDNAFLPAPGSTVQVRYLLARKARCGE